MKMFGKDSMILNAPMTLDNNIKRLVEPYLKDKTLKLGEWYSCDFKFKIRRDKTKSLFIDTFQLKRLEK